MEQHQPVLSGLVQICQEHFQRVCAVLGQCKAGDARLGGLGPTVTESHFGTVWTAQRERWLDLGAPGALHSDGDHVPGAALEGIAIGHIVDR